MSDDLRTAECPTCGRPGFMPVNNANARTPTRADHTRFVLLPPRYSIQQGQCDGCPQMITYKAICHGKYYCRACSDAPCDCTREPTPGDERRPKGPGPRPGLRVVK